MYPGEKVLHTVNLQTNPPEVKESPVRRTFGLIDMYRDLTASGNQQDLESQLSRLEEHVSRIIRDICEAFNNKHQATWMSRSERNDLRKFFFIMKYRGQGFHNRFSGDEDGNYTADDKEQFLKYMHEHGYSRPMDVWYHSIKTILDLEMDHQDQWTKTLPSQIYPDDAHWFILHTQWMYLAFCTPDDPDQEFIITDNSYAVFEGPSSMAIDPVSHTRRVVSWTSYHEFGPLTPRLIMVLRSFLLPSHDEDKNDNIRAWRENWYKQNASLYPDADAAKSILADLPVHKARNSYTSVSESGMQLQDGEDGTRQSYHRFCFRFFKISAAHVDVINAVMLENADEKQIIAFKSREAFKRTLEHFVTLPAEARFKVVLDVPDHPKLKYLQNLENVLHQLGCSSKLVYHSSVLPSEYQVLTAVEREMAKDLPKERNEYAMLHEKLGKCAKSIRLPCITSRIGGTLPPFCDMDQVRRMINLRIIIGVWSQGVDETKRSRA
jgi:hypothetical protein